MTDPRSRVATVTEIDDAIERFARANITQALLRIALASGVRARDLLGRNRHKRVAAARKELYVLLRYEFALSYPEIGALMGRDHTTVLTAVRGADAKRAGERDRELVADVRRALAEIDRERAAAARAANIAEREKDAAE